MHRRTTNQQDWLNMGPNNYFTVPKGMDRGRHSRCFSKNDINKLQSLVICFIQCMSLFMRVISQMLYQTKYQFTSVFRLKTFCLKTFRNHQKNVTVLDRNLPVWFVMTNDISARHVTISMLMECWTTKKTIGNQRCPTTLDFL